MEKKFWVIGAVVYLLLGIILSSCSNNRSALFKKKKPSRPVTTIVYSISSLSAEGKIMGKPALMTVSFDGSQSVTTELSAITGFYDTTSFHRSKNDSMMIVSQQLPWRRAVFSVRNESHEIIPDSLAPVFDYSVTEILGYNCKKAVFQQDKLRWEVWFSPDLEMHDSTNASISHPEIDGLILKVIRSYGSGEYYAATQYEVSSLKLDQPQSLLDLPSDETIYKGGDPRNFFLQQFDSITARQDTIPWQFKDRFLGEWSFAESESLIAVERYGEVYVVRIYSNAFDVLYGKNRSIDGRFYAGKLWFLPGTKWHWLQLCGKDELCFSACSDCRLVRWGSVARSDGRLVIQKHSK